MSNYRRPVDEAMDSIISRAENNETRVMFEGNEAKSALRRLRTLRIVRDRYAHDISVEVRSSCTDKYLVESLREVANDLNRRMSNLSKHVVRS